MNDMRQQLYVTLVEQILCCVRGQEMLVLQRYPDLLDPGLLTVMGQYADWLESQGNGNAQRVRDFAVQLAAAIGLETTAPEGKGAARQFLLETLQLIVEKQCNPQQIYPLWAQQQARFNADLLSVLPDVINVTEEDAERTFIASVLANFGNLIHQFPLGTHWLNLELGIAAYELSLQVMTQDAMPVEWAQLMNALAGAYTFRIRGDQAQNIEAAIAVYKQSLQVRTRDAMPVEWAESMNNLAVAYADRIQGDRAQNLEEAIAAYEQSLQVRTRESMPIEWAQSIMNLANAYINRIQGDRAQNLEEAIAACELSLQVRTRESMPIEWAKSMNILAIAYADRIQGDHAQNLEEAIAACEQSLQVRTRESMPIEWAKSMNNLANVYINRIRGDRAQNLEEAIAACEQSLQVKTRESMPVEWAETMNILATAYAVRIEGDRAKNLEEAIAVYKQSLQMRTRDAMPVEWAESMNNLAVAYADRIQGDRAQNLEEAIAAYEQSLQVMTRDAMPIEWAQSIMNLANAYINRIQGDRAQNLEEAIAAYEQSLQVMTRDAMPIEWSQLMMNLASAYAKRIRGDQSQNIEAAIAAYKQSLQIRTREHMPVKWAELMNNLASAYAKRIRGDRAQNLEEAIAAYKQSLQVRTRESMPIDWAQSMNNLASAYQDRIRGDRAQNLEEAIARYKASLEIFTLGSFPDDCRKTSRFLGNLYFEQKHWQEAVSSYQTALQATEMLYQGASLLDSKSAELSETNDLPRRATYAIARTGNLQKAVEILEQGRARGLSESLDRDRANLEQLQLQTPTLYQQYKDLTEQLRTLEAQQRDRMTSTNRNSLTPESLRETATDLRQRFDALIQRIRQVHGYEKFLILPTFEGVRRATSTDRPLVYLITTSAGSLALLITLNNIDAIWLNNFTDKELIDLLNNTWFAAYRKSQQNRQDWYDAIDSVTRQLWEPLMEPLIRHLQTQNIDRAILIPTGYLSLLPLHATWTEDATTPTGRRYALDDIHFTYTPNAKSLTAAQAIADRTQANSILAIDNPRQDLPNSESEIQQAIHTFLPHAEILRHSRATTTAVKKALPQAGIAHFSCHGTANLNDPLDSGLLMSDGLLTLRDVLALNLSDRGGIRLVILSACETGLSGIENADEAIGLPTGLLQAGVAGVVASLWSVSDLSTMILLARFYDLWRIERLEIDEALRQAQRWVRDTTNGEKIAYFKDFMPTQSATKMPSSTADYLYKSLILSRPEARKFARPFDWAAFSYVGV